MRGLRAFDGAKDQRADCAPRRDRDTLSAGRNGIHKETWLAVFQVASGVRSTVGTTVAPLRPYRLAVEERVDEACELRDVKKVMLPSSAEAAAETN